MKLNNVFILKWLVVCFVMLTIGCKQENTSSKNQASYQEKQAVLFSKKVAIKNSRKVKLIPQAEEAVVAWPEYITAKTEIEKIPEFTIQDVVSNANNLLQSITRMRDTIPNVFDKVPVQSRINVLFTKANVLVQQAGMQQPNAAQIEETVITVYKAFGDFEIQLNEVFMKSVEDFEKALEKSKNEKSTAPKASINNARFQHKKLAPKKFKIQKDSIQ